MALLGTPQKSTGFFPRDETRSFSVDCAAKWETAGFLHVASRSGCWGVPNKYPVDYYRETVLAEWRNPPGKHGWRKAPENNAEALLEGSLRDSFCRGASAFWRRVPDKYPSQEATKDPVDYRQEPVSAERRNPPGIHGRRKAPGPKAGGLLEGFLHVAFRLDVLAFSRRAQQIPRGG